MLFRFRSVSFYVSLCHEVFVTLKSKTTIKKTFLDLALIQCFSLVESIVSVTSMAASMSVHPRMEESSMDDIHR